MIVLIYKLSLCMALAVSVRGDNGTSLSASSGSMLENREQIAVNGNPNIFIKALIDEVKDCLEYKMSVLTSRVDNLELARDSAADNREMEENLEIQRTREAINNLQDEVDGIKENVSEVLHNLQDEVDGIKDNVSTVLHNRENDENAEIQRTREAIHYLQDEIDGIKNNVSTVLRRNTTGSGGVYVRWGSKSCPNATASLVYTGFTAGGFYQHSGGAASPLCLQSDPTDDDVTVTSGCTTNTFIYGSEYECPQPKSSSNNRDVSCAVCDIKKRTRIHMTPGKNKCEDGWTLEYNGYLMGNYYTHGQNLDYVCMDKSMEPLDGGDANRNGQLFYHVVPDCNYMKCPPYKSGRRITCAVCSK